MLCCRWCHVQANCGFSVSSTRAPMTSTAPLRKEDVMALATVRGQGTSVITVHAKPGSDLTDLLQRMRTEVTTAANIKCRL